MQLAALVIGGAAEKASAISAAQSSQQASNAWQARPGCASKVLPPLPTWMCAPRVTVVLPAASACHSCSSVYTQLAGLGGLGGAGGGGRGGRGGLGGGLAYSG